MEFEYLKQNPNLKMYNNIIDKNFKPKFELGLPKKLNIKYIDKLTNKINSKLSLKSKYNLSTGFLFNPRLNFYNGDKLSLALGEKTCKIDMLMSWDHRSKNFDNKKENSVKKYFLGVIKSINYELALDKNSFTIHNCNISTKTDDYGNFSFSFSNKKFNKKNNDRDYQQDYEQQAEERELDRKKSYKNKDNISHEHFNEYFAKLSYTQKFIGLFNTKVRN